MTTLAPRAGAIASLEVSTGTYVLLSFSPGAGGAPQFLSGLLTELTVP